MTSLDWAAKLVEEEGEALARSFLRTVEEGDWRAADALMNRIYGKLEAALVARAAPNPAADVIRSMSLEEKLELLQALRRGEADDPRRCSGSSRQSRRPRSPSPPREFPSPR